MPTSRSGTSFSDEIRAMFMDDEDGPRPVEIHHQPDSHDDNVAIYLRDRYEGYHEDDRFRLFYDVITKNGLIFESESINFPTLTPQESVEGYEREFVTHLTYSLDDGNDYPADRIFKVNFASTDLNTLGPIQLRSLVSFIIFMPLDYETILPNPYRSRRLIKYNNIITRVVLSNSSIPQWMKDALCEKSREITDVMNEQGEGDVMPPWSSSHRRRNRQQPNPILSMAKSAKVDIIPKNSKICKHRMLFEEYYDCEICIGCNLSELQDVNKCRESNLIKSSKIVKEYNTWKDLVSLQKRGKYYDVSNHLKNMR